MNNTDQIEPDMPVVCSQDGQFATVDHMEGPGTTKLKKDETGQHHYIPVSWVTSIADGKVKVGSSRIRGDERAVDNFAKLHRRMTLSQKIDKRRCGYWLLLRS